MGTADDASTWRGRIPADIDRPEPVAFNLTARQLLILAPALLAAWGLFLLLREAVPLWVLGTALAPLIGIAAVAAVGERDGMSLDRFATAALSWATRPKHYVPASTGRVPELPTWAPRAGGRRRLAPLRLPARAITPEGVIDLGGRCAAIISCTTLPFQLASGREQDQTLAAFAGVLDSLAEPVQILIQRRSHDLSPFTELLRHNATRLPHPALAESAHAHADFLDDLARTHELSQQQVLVVVTATGTSGRSGGTVRRCAQDTATRMAALGIRTHVLDGTEAERALRQSLTAPGGRLTDPDPNTGTRDDHDLDSESEEHS